MNDLFDLQLNGYVGADFNADGLKTDDLHKACAALRADGVGGFLATVVTDDIEVMCGRLARIVEVREEDSLAKEMIAGVHIEGPFLNESHGYRGGHIAEWIRPADVETAKRLLDAAGGLTKIVTLAPEGDANQAVTKFLADENIVVAAGHCNASLEELKAGIDAGLSMFTHVSNGCAAQIPRHDNIIERVLSLADKLWLTFIADGVHIPFFVLGNYIKLAGPERSIVVSDATVAAGLGPGRYSIGKWGNVMIGEDLAAWSPDGTHLLGSAVSISVNAKNLKEHLGMDEGQIRKLTWDNPRKSIGLETGS